MPTIFRRTPWTRRSARRSFIPPSAGVVTEVIGVTQFALTLSAKDILETETTPVTQQALTFTGGSVIEQENEIVSAAALTLTAQNVVENDGSLIAQQALTFTGQTVNLIDSESTPVDKDDLAFTGGTVNLLDDDTIAITKFSVAITPYDVSPLDYAPQGGLMAGGGGGNGAGPASDAAYHARQKYLQDKRDADTRRWKGEPAKPPDATEAKPAAQAKAKAPPEPEPIGPDLDALFGEILAPLPLPLSLPPRPARVFDPEDDVAVLLLTDL